MKTPKDLAMNQFPRSRDRFFSRAMLPLAIICAGATAGCESQLFPPPDVLNAPAATGASKAVNGPASITLRESDVLKITFPGSPALDTTQEIRRDGKIDLPLIGEVDAAGLTPPALEKKLVDLYAAQLTSKQVVVEVASSSFPVYVTGMVLHPGKILSDHPITAIEAVMEAGGFDYTKANLKNVTIIRREKNTMKNHTVNLKSVLEGQPSEPFELKPDDIVYVPERFSMF